MLRVLSAIACVCLVAVMGNPVEAGWKDLIQKGKAAVDNEVEKAKAPYGNNSASKYNSDKTMVLQAQRQLQRLGYAVSVDGAYGPGTKGAIEKFQQSKGMSVNGNVSPKLVKKLTKAPTPAKAASKPSPAKGASQPQSVLSNTTVASSGSSSSNPAAPGSSPVAPPPKDDGSASYYKLFKLYMASQGDILNLPAVASVYYHKYEIPFGIGTNAYNYKPSAECKAYNQKWVGADEFAVIDLIKSERAAFGRALQSAKSWPKTATFTLVGSGTLGNYDMKGEKFPLKVQLSGVLPQNKNVEPGECRPQIIMQAREALSEGRNLVPNFRFESVDISSITEIAMSKDRAKSYLNAHKVDHKGNPAPNAQPNRSVKLEAEAVFGPITVKAGQLQPVPIRLLSARVIDPLNGKTLLTHKNSESSSSDSGSSLDLGKSLPANRESLALIALKYHPELLTDEAALELTEHQIITEQSSWKRIDDYLKRCKAQASACPTLNKQKPAFIYEWQSLIKTRPGLANGAVLDLYGNPNASWEFVKQEKEWDDRFQAVVGVFVFSRDAVVGRDPKFLARELVTTWKRHLAAVLKKAPSRLHISTRIVDAAYNFDSKAVDISPEYKGNLSSKKQARYDFPDLFLPNIEPGFDVPDIKNWPSSGALVFPGSAKNALVYRAGVVSANQNYYPQRLSAAGNDENNSSNYWRDGLSRHINVNWLALDRRLSLSSLKMDPAAGERFVTQFRTSGLEALVTFEAVRADLGRIVYRNKQPESKAPIVFGKIQNVGLMNREKKVLSSFRPSDFPSASSVAAAADKAKQAAAVNAQQAELDAASKKQQKRDSLLAECDGRASKLERLKCRHETCRQNYDLFDRQVCNEVGQQLSRAAAVDRDCRSRFQYVANTLDVPKPGSEPFEAAVKVCLGDPKRESYGPDIVGLRLGSDFNEAESTARQRFSENGYMNGRHKRPYPFENSALMWERKSGDEGIALFAIRSNQQRELLAGISRRIYFGAEGPKRSDILKGLRDKYGEEASSNGNTTVWAFPPKQSKLKDKSKCAPLAKMIRGRGGWEPAWKKPIDYKAQQAKMRAERDAVQATYRACSSKVQNTYMKKFEGASESKINKLSIEMQEETTKCSDAYSAASSSLSTSAQADNRPERMPLMIEGGNPKGYYSYRACGPILVTRFAPGDGGRVKGAAFVLFDPGWVGRQPGFMFQSSKKPEKKSGGQGGAIDF